MKAKSGILSVTFKDYESGETLSQYELEQTGAALPNIIGSAQYEYIQVFDVQ